MNKQVALAFLLPVPLLGKCCLVPSRLDSSSEKNDEGHLKTSLLVSSIEFCRLVKQSVPADL